MDPYGEHEQARTEEVYETARTYAVQITQQTQVAPRYSASSAKQVALFCAVAGLLRAYGEAQVARAPLDEREGNLPEHVQELIGVFTRIAHKREEWGLSP